MLINPSANIYNRVSLLYLCCTFAVLRSHITEWDIAETQGKGPFPEILEYDIFVNCILLNEVLVVKHVNSSGCVTWGRVLSEKPNSPRQFNNKWEKFKEEFCCRLSNGEDCFVKGWGCLSSLIQI